MYEVFSDGARSGAEPSVTRAFEAGRRLADLGAADVEILHPLPGGRVEAWRWVPGRGFLPVVVVRS